MLAINRVLLLGNRALAISVLDFLLAQPGVSILAVANPDDDGIDGPGGLSLVRRLKARNVPFIQPKGINSPEILAELAAFAPDLAISCSYARLIPQSVIDLPRHACLNIHYAALPINRGCLPVIWTIAGGEAEYAATLHCVHVGIDDGPILAQLRRPLTPGMTTAEVNAACAVLGFDLFRAFWQQNRQSGRVDAVAQDETAVTYHTFRFPHERWIPWHRPAPDVANLVNALTYLPHPSARTRREGSDDEVHLLGSALAIAGRAAPPGTILDAGADLVVACGDGAIVLQAMREGDRAVSVSGNFAPGQRLVSPMTEFYAE